MRSVALVGTGFVADLYAASLRTFPDIHVTGCFDRDQSRLQRFTAHWGLPAAQDLNSVIAGDATIVINLTNPHEHLAVSRAALSAGKHVYTEKPLSTDFAGAQELLTLARSRNLQIASAPCSMFSQAAQTVRAALVAGRIGRPRLVYAELDDNFILKAPFSHWKSESGAPWPAEDEFKVGCTLEHAGYYLTWLMAIFGPVEKVVAASAQVTDVPFLEKGAVAADFSTAVLSFKSGIVARLTCSVVAPHDHSLRIFGDDGVLEVGECWNNTATVRVRRRHVLRRRLVDGLWARRIKPGLSTQHPMVRRRGAAAMNFMLGPAEMLDAIERGNESRLAGNFALHLTEVSLAIQNAGFERGVQVMTSTFNIPDPVRWSGTRTLV